MTTRRLNWTGRRRIPRERARISLAQVDGHTSFSAVLELASLGFPPEARVVVEAYRQAGWMRFDFGSVSLVAPPRSTWLEEFDPVDGVLFRVKVLGTAGEHGRILGEADGIRPSDPSAAESDNEPLLIPRGADLGEEVWRLNIDEGSMPPELLVNRSLGDWQAVARSPQFVWLVYPEVLRRILRAVLDGDTLDPEDTESWRARWVRFASTLPGVSAPPGEGSDLTLRENWVDDAVQSFCRVHRFRDRFEALITGGNEP